MKSVLVACIALAVVSADTEYSGHAETFDIEAALADINVFKAFAGCFVGTEPCNGKVATDFKKDLETAFPLCCEGCSVAQKHALRRFLESLVEKLPQEHEMFLKKFDPEGKYITCIEAAIANF